MLVLVAVVVVVVVVRLRKYGHCRSKAIISQLNVYISAILFQHQNQLRIKTTFTSMVLTLSSTATVRCKRLATTSPQISNISTAHADIRTKTMSVTRLSFLERHSNVAPYV